MKFLFKAIIWPIKKILLFPIKLLFFIVFSLIVLIFFIQYQMDFDKDVSPLSGLEVETCTAVIEDTNLDAISAISNFVDSLTEEEKELLGDRLPDSLSPLMDPSKLDEDDYERIKNSLKFYIQLARIPGFNGKALAPQAADLCRSALS
tara:strand:- start:34 stop:477 length:444 start_codon:yes stop_codon:yes gene_type:complete